MRKKQLEKLNEELTLKVEKQRLLIKKLEEDILYNQQHPKTETVFVEKYSPSKPSILENYGTDLLLKQAMTINGSFVFSCSDRKPLDLISFDEWYKGLTRNDLIGNLKLNNPEVFAYLDELDLLSIKTFFKSALVNHYEKEKEKYINMLNDIVIKEFGKARGGK